MRKDTRLQRGGKPNKKWSKNFVTWKRWRGNRITNGARGGKLLRKRKLEVCCEVTRVKRRKIKC